VELVVMTAEGTDVVVGERTAHGAAGDGFASFYERERASVLGLAFVLCGRLGVAEELTQEAFLRAFRDWDRLAGYDEPGAWVRRVVANLATSSWRRRASETKAMVRLRARREPPQELHTDDDEFWASVRALPTRQAQCVALHYLEDRPVAEIAEVLGIAEPTVRVHLHAGRKALAATLGETVEDER
jgi:RNA polymerase sigma-70 factor (ECF subfamily)